MSSWHNVFPFVICTICSLGAMIGLIVASTISLHQHHGLPRPTLLMGSIAVPTARSDDPGVLTTSRSPRPLVVHGINSLQHQDLLLVHDHVSQQQRQSQHWRTWRHDSPTLSWHDSMAIYGRACWIHSSRFPSSSTYDSLSCPQTSGRQLRSAAAQGGVSAHWAGHDIAATTQQLYSTLHTLLRNCRQHMPCRACSLLGTTILQSMQHDGSASPVTSTSFTQPSSCLALSRIFNMVSATNKSTGWQSGCCSDCYAQGYPQSVSQPAALCAITHATARNFPSLSQMGNCTAQHRCTAQQLQPRWQASKFSMQCAGDRTTAIHQQWISSRCLATIVHLTLCASTQHAHALLQSANRVLVGDSVRHGTTVVTPAEHQVNRHSAVQFISRMLQRAMQQDQQLVAQQLMQLARNTGGLPRAPIAAQQLAHIAAAFTSASTAAQRFAHIAAAFTSASTVRCHPTQNNAVHCHPPRNNRFSVNRTKAVVQHLALQQLATYRLALQRLHLQLATCMQQFERLMAQQFMQSAPQQLMQSAPMGTYSLHRIS